MTSVLTPPKRLRVVLDEGHSIKNQATRQARAALKLKTERRWVVTGTPLQVGGEWGGRVDGWGADGGGWWQAVGPDRTAVRLCAVCCGAAQHTTSAARK